MSKPSITPALAALTVLTVTLAATVLVGCATLTGPPPITLAVTATGNEPVPSVGPISDLLTEYAGGALDPGDATVRVVTPDGTRTVDLTPMRGDEVEASAGQISRKVAANIAQLQEDLRATTTSGALDVIGVLDRALEQTPAGGRVIVETSGFATVAPVDLTAAGDWIGDPDGFVARVAGADLPDASGRSITFVGLGYPAANSSQTVAGPAARRALTTIMTGLCVRMKATSCGTLPGPISNELPASGGSAQTVSLQPVATACVGGQIDIDTQIAFDPNSSVLLAAADQQLGPIVQSLQACPQGLRVDATGFSARLPGQSRPATELEEARARAVLERLAALGVSAVSIGEATAGGQLVDNVPGGVFREDLAVRNRVVQLTVSATH